MESKLNRFSVQDHAILCNQIVKEGSKHPSLLNNYMNFIKSGPPYRVLLYENEGWIDFLEEERDIDSVEREFRAGNSFLFEVKFRDTPYLADFIHMVVIDLNTGLQLPMGWINKDHNCFFPLLGESSAAPAPAPTRAAPKKRLKRKDGEGEVCSRKVIKGNKALKSLPQKNIDTMFAILTKEEQRHLFLNKDRIVGMSGLSDDLAQARSKLFENQVEFIQKRRGNANVRYAWLGASKVAVSKILKDGVIVLRNLPKANPTYGVGVHLASASSSHISACYCDADEDGIQCMVLCRVILGSMEVVHPGSEQFSPSTDYFDSGVDDLLKPKHYIIWNKNMHTHIYPEYVVSFKKPPVAEEDPSSSAKEDPSSSVEEGPQTSVPLVQHKNTAITGPLFPIPMLLTEMEDKVPYSVMKMVYEFYEQQKQKKMSKDQFFQMMRSLVGDALLRDALISLRPKLH